MRAEGEQDESGYHSLTVAVTVDEQSGRYSHDEISEISHDLNQRGLRDVDVKLVLEMFVQHVENGSRKSPHEEQ